MDYNKFLIIVLSFFTLSLSAQNEFGQIGSYWVYGFEPHSGGGGGWQIISVERDTMVDGDLGKILQVENYAYTTNGMFEESYNVYPRILKIRNDSIFNVGFSEELILDFSMQISDTMAINIFENLISLSTDSIGVEEVDGIPYQKWYGKKLCYGEEAYESYTIVESIGQVGTPDNNELPSAGGYLFWNLDGCQLGGGRFSFTCYKSGSFVYPPSVGTCDKPELPTSAKSINELSNVQIFPNPTSSILTIESNLNKIENIVVLSSLGSELWGESTNAYELNINVSHLTSGMYWIRISTKEGEVTKRFYLQKD